MWRYLYVWVNWAVMATAGCLTGTTGIELVVMDMRAVFGKYQDLTGCPVIISDNQESIGLTKEDRIKFQFHTTWVKPQLDASNIAEIKRTLGPKTPHHGQ